MNTSKRILSGLLSLFLIAGLVFTAMPMQAFATEADSTSTNNMMNVLLNQNETPPEGFDPDEEANPYGDGKNEVIMMTKENELLLWRGFPNNNALDTFNFYENVDENLYSGTTASNTWDESHDFNANYASAAAIRSKGALTIENVTIGVKSTGTGGKGINNVGNVILKNSVVTVVASGATHQQNALDSRSRGIDTDGSLMLDGGSLQIRSYDEPMQVADALTFSANAHNAGYEVK